MRIPSSIRTCRAIIILTRCARIRRDELCSLEKIKFQCLNFDCALLNRVIYETHDLVGYICLFEGCVFPDVEHVKQRRDVSKCFSGCYVVEDPCLIASVGEFVKCCSVLVACLPYDVDELAGVSRVCWPKC